MVLERDFVENYLFDNQYGGTYFSVDGKGIVLDSSKNIIFQTNIILDLAGMQSQVPDPQINRHIDSAAGFVLKYLKWGGSIEGTWYFSSNRTGADLHPMDWLSASEAYVSYGLLWAYRMTGNRSYLDVAQRNLNYQMTNFPDGHIMTDLPIHSGDITYRSPERMTYYSMWKLTGNRSYLDFANKIQSAALGVNGWERANINGTIVKLGAHGNSIVDEVLFALASGDQTALNEGRQLLEDYWAGGYNARDDYQNFLYMDLAMWTITHDTKYRMEAERAYNHLLEFWDPSPPYGFWADIGRTKTCFSRGYPSVDMTPPVIEADPQGQKVSARIVDPSYKWLDLTFDGIGVNPNSVYLFYSLNGQNWAGNMKMAQTGDDTFTALVPQTISSQNPTYLISASDYFNNTSTVQFTKSSAPQPLTTAFTSATTSALTSSSDFGFGVIAAGLAAAALAVALLCCFAHRPAMGGVAAVGAAAPERYVRCRCPFWYECERKHNTCPTCSGLRAQGACCMCQGTPTNSCNHPADLKNPFG